MTLRWPSIPRPAAAGLLGGLGGLALGGCVDPQGRFDDFTARPLVLREASAPDNSVPDAGASEASRTPARICSRKISTRNTTRRVSPRRPVSPLPWLSTRG